MLPAVLSLMDRRINSLRVPFLKEESAKRRRHEKSGFWNWVSEQVTNHPVIALLLALVILLACAYPVFDLEIGQSDVNTLPPQYESRQGLDILGEEFSAGMLAPVKIVIDQYDTADMQAGTASLQQALVSDVDFQVSQVELNSEGDVALMTVFLTEDPYSSQATEAVDTLRDDILPAAFGAGRANVMVTGFTAFNCDFFQITEVYTPFIFAFVLGLSFVLLLVVFRSLVVAFASIIFTMLSVGAAYGLIVLVFQKGVGANFFGFLEIESIDAWVPLFLFCMLFGLSMDYQVFLMSRIRERFDQTDDTKDAICFGIRSTAGLIVGAALIMAVVFGGFASGQFVVMQEMGFGLAVAVLVDVFVVRVVLVPSVLTLLGRRSWYMPSWLQWLPDVRVEVESDKN